jgi:hypothetical protein
MMKALVEFKFCRLGKHIFKPSDYGEIPLHQSCGTTGRIKQMGMHNRSENGRRARVALCVYPTHTDIALMYQNKLKWPCPWLIKKKIRKLNYCSMILNRLGAYNLA